MGSPNTSNACQQLVVLVSLVLFPVDQRHSPDIVAGLPLDELLWFNRLQGLHDIVSNTLCDSGTLMLEGECLLESVTAHRGELLQPIHAQYSVVCA